MIACLFFVRVRMRGFAARVLADVDSDGTLLTTATTALLVEARDEEA